MDVRETCDRLQKDGHPDPIAVEGVAAAVDTKWKQLMTKAEERRAVVFSSYNFYRSAEQVMIWADLRINIIISLNCDDKI